VISKQFKLNQQIMPSGQHDDQSGGINLQHWVSEGQNAKEK
jgi:hypothetical protein